MDLFDVTLTIDRVQLLQGHTEYVIKVNIGVGDVVLHTNEVTTRYSSLEENFDAKLRAYGVNLGYPPKKVFGSMNREFIAERQAALQKYLDKVCSNVLVTTSLPFRSFFFPESIRGKHDEEKALTHLSVQFRSNPGWTVVKPLAQIGWRSSRYAFEVKPIDPSVASGVFLASWSEFATSTGASGSAASSGADLKQALRYVQSMRHPHVAPLVHTIVDELGVLSIRAFAAGGSLRDLVHNLRPPANVRESFLKKYWNVSDCATLPVLPIQHVRSIGRQILEALIFLQEKSIVFGHLHAGNVLVTNIAACTCQLTDVEDVLLGFTPFYTWNARRLHRVVTLESMAVFAFGHTLYECVFGRMLTDAGDSSSGSLAQNAVPRMLTELLERLVLRSGVRQGLPSLSDLLANPIFQNAPQPDADASKRRKSAPPKGVNDAEANLVGAAKMTDSVKRVLDAAQSRIEERLKEEQRLMAIQRRKSKAESRQSMSALMQGNSDAAKSAE